MAQKQLEEQRLAFERERAEWELRKQRDIAEAKAQAMIDAKRQADEAAKAAAEEAQSKAAKKKVELSPVFVPPPSLALSPSGEQWPSPRQRRGSTAGAGPRKRGSMIRMESWDHLRNIIMAASSPSAEDGEVVVRDESQCPFAVQLAHVQRLCLCS